MKKRNKLLTLLLCAALITVNLPVSSSAVYAAGEAAEPSKTAYADKKGLQENYDLVDDPVDVGGGVKIDKSVQKVYFGKNGSDKQQAWKIVGKDTQIGGDNIVLFADSAIKTPGGEADGTINFLAGWTPNDDPPTNTVETTGKVELESLGITYSSYPSEVYVNHYGRSTLRDELRKMAENTSYFTAAQQDLMNPTTITTNDTKNSTNYTTTDILYAAYGNWDDDQHITVGTNNKDGNLNDGLRIDKQINGVGIWESSNPPNTFWLRAPSDGNDDCALIAVSISVDRSRVGSDHSVVPAFDLNLSNVLFASSAPAAEAGAKDLSVTTNPDGTKKNDTMTFRWADKTGNKIKSTATWNEDGVNVTKGSETADVYLCVQGNNGDKDWIWSQKVNDVTSPIKADTIASALKNVFSSPSPPAVDLTQCKIWLETTVENDGLTYAKQAKKLAKPTTNTQFATVGELMKFDTDDSNGQNPAKVYFGENNQRWWIAGVDEKIEDENGKKIEKNIVLFAASPITTTAIPFNTNTGTKDYADSWNCGYYIDMTGKKVNANHYGGSTLRNNTLKNLETDTNYFTAEEQKLMNATTVYTEDTANSNVAYSTKDKLYLAYGKYNGTFVTVGTNSAAGLNSGLRVDNNYWVNYFWLRAPHDGSNALVAVPTYFVDITPPVNDYNRVVPAFDLNLSSVIFASAAPAATGDGGQLDTKDVTKDGAFTLRYKSDSIGTATLSTDKKSVSISGVSADKDTYLVAQNSEGAQAKKVSDGDVISIDVMYPDLATFENCQIWLETTTGGLTYAKQAQTGTDGQSQGSNSNKGGQNNGNKGVNTGDESNPALWIALMLIALAGAGGTALYTKKKKAK